jgi:hypothetical protein
MTTMESVTKLMGENVTQINSDSLELQFFCACEGENIEALKVIFNQSTNAIEVHLDLQPYLDLINSRNV